MATLSALVDKVRLELGDQGKSFVQQFVADGTTNRFKLGYAPLDAPTVMVFQNGVDISNDCSVEESTGILVTDTVPADGVEFTVSGTYYRYFTNAEMEAIVSDAVVQHASHHTDSLGRQITVSNLPQIEEYPVAIYAVTLALYTLATDASFDIDIAAPDGVNIPRSERYRQLMDMINVRQNQYRELCMLLGIGLYKIDVFSLRRVALGTGRLVPMYKPQEVDDRSWPQRVHVPAPTYGDAPTPWPTQAQDITAYQDRAFSTTLTVTNPGSVLDSWAVKLLSQRGGVLVAQQFSLDNVTNTDGVYEFAVSLTREQTRMLANRTWWSVQAVNDTTNETIEVLGGYFFTQKAVEAIL